MRPTRLRLLVAIAAATTVAGLVVLRIIRSLNGTMAPVPWTAAGALVLVAALVYAAAVPVRRWVRQGRAQPKMDPLRAARVAVLGKATAIAGAAVTGWYLAQVLQLTADLDVTSRRGQAVRAGITAVAAIVASAAGLLAERMCRVPPPPEDREHDPDGDTDVTPGVQRHD